MSLQKRALLKSYSENLAYARLFARGKTVDYLRPKASLLSQTRHELRYSYINYVQNSGLNCESGHKFMQAQGYDC